ncbi:MAG: galactokinase [Bdellovibrionales bacterium]|nr:galactokinase [Bdellovibrionales bacterium]
MKTIEIQSPTRIDLSGGTLDLWPLYSFMGGCKTVNLSISVMTQAFLEENHSQNIEIDIQDLQFRKVYSDLNQVLESQDREISLIQEVVRYYKPKRGFKLSTKSMSPVGGGLGGSSSLVISILKAFDQWIGISRDVHELVKLASNVEAKTLNTPTGTQDYYPAAIAGLQTLHYGMDGIKQEILPFPEKLFEDSLLLVYTGRPHHSGINNWQVFQKVVDRDKDTCLALQKIKEISEEVYKVCLSKSWNRFPELFNQEFEWRLKLSSGFSSPEIEKLKKIVAQFKNSAVKICGAGGGGCVFIWTDEKELVRQAIIENGYQILNMRPVS